MNKNLAMIVPLLSAAAGAAHAGIGVASLGTSFPPSAVVDGDAAGQTAIHAPLDGRPLLADVNDVMFTATTGISFSNPMNHRRIGQGWATWSHDYVGDVYRNLGSTQLTLTMSMISPTGYDYFAFYAEPSPFSTFSILVTGVDSTGAAISLSQNAAGEAGAVGWAFFAIGGSSITSITLVNEVDFAVGEFLYHERVPAPGSLAAFGLTSLAAARRRR